MSFSPISLNPSSLVNKTGTFFPKIPGTSTNSTTSKTKSKDSEIANTQRSKIHASAPVATPRPLTPNCATYAPHLAPLNPSGSLPLIPKNAQKDSVAANNISQVASTIVLILKNTNSLNKVNNEKLKNLIIELSKTPPQTDEKAALNLRALSTELNACILNFKQADLDTLIEKINSLLVSISNKYKKEDIIEIVAIPAYLSLKQTKRAFDFAFSIQDERIKSWALYRIVKYFNELKRPEDSLLTFNMISLPYKDDHILSKIALLFISQGHIDKAMELASQIEDAIPNGAVYSQIVDYYLAQSKPDLAFSIAQKIFQADYKEKAYIKIAKYFFQCNITVKALGFLKLMKNESNKLSLIQEGIQHYIDWELPDEALSLTKKIVIQEKFLLNIAYLFLKKDEIKKVWDLIPRLQDENNKASLLYKMAQFYLKAQDYTYAYKTVLLLPLNEAKVNLLFAIANHYLWKMDLKNAQNILQAIPKDYPRTIDDLQLKNPLEHSMATDILFPESLVKLEKFWKDKLSNPNKVVSNFYYKVLGSDPLNRQVMGGFTPCHLTPWINDLIDFNTTLVSPEWKQRISQVINELTFAYQIAFAVYSSNHQLNAAIHYILERLMHLPLPHESENASFSHLILSGGTTYHSVMYLISRQTENHFTFRIINSGEGCEVSAEKMAVVNTQHKAINQLKAIEAALVKDLRKDEFDQLMEKKAQIKKEINELEVKIQNFKIGDLTFTNLALKELSNNFFQLLITSFRGEEKMKMVLSLIDKMLAKPDKSNVSIQGRPHQYQRMDNCTVKSMSLTIRERIGEEISPHFKVHVTKKELALFEKFILEVKKQPPNTFSPTWLTEIEMYLNEGKKKLVHRHNKTTKILNKVV